MKVLVVEDEPMARQNIIKYLKRISDEFVFFEAENSVQALEVLRNNKIDIVLLDFEIHGVRGIHLIKDIKMLCPGARIIPTPGLIGDSEVEHLFENGIYKFFTKPINLEKLGTYIMST